MVKAETKTTNGIEGLKIHWSDFGEKMEALWINMTYESPEKM